MTGRIGTITESTRQSLRRRFGLEQVTRVLVELLEHHRNESPQRELRVLEAGVGGGVVLSHLHTRLGQMRKHVGSVAVELWGFDLGDTSPAVRRLAEIDPSIAWDERIRTGRDGAWPFESGAFDVVLSNQVLEHVEDIDVFMREARRVLLPGGTSVHVFPAKTMLIEPHLFVPFVHHLSTDASRLRLLRSLYRFRLHKGRARGPRDPYRDVAYLRSSTFYRTWQEVHAAGRSAGFASVPRYSLGYITGPLRNEKAFWPRAELPPQSSIRDLLSVSIASRLFSVTLVSRKAATLHSESSDSKSDPEPEAMTGGLD